MGGSGHSNTQNFSPVTHAQIDKNNGVKSAIKSSNSPSNSVVKVTSYKYTSGELKAHVNYLTRNGRTEAEDDLGNIIKGKDVYEYTKDWVVNHQARGDGDNKRLSAAISISAPAGTNHKDLQDAVRDFMRTEFSEHRYLMVLHSPETEAIERKKTDHPHVHVVLENISPESERALYTDPEVFRSWRREFKEIARSYGIDLSREENNLSRSSPLKKQNHYRMLKRGEVPEVYKDDYELAVNRLNRGHQGLTEKETELINDAVTQFQNREQQIKDLTSLAGSTQVASLEQRYKKEIVYLQSINSSERLPLNRSQMFMKHALHQARVLRGYKLKFNLKGPTVKHYVYAQKLAKDFGVELPSTAHFDLKKLSEFTSKYHKQPSPKLINFANHIADKSGLERPNGGIQEIRGWINKHKHLPSVKQMAMAVKLSNQFAVSLPEDISSKTVGDFIKSYINKPSKQMQAYAQYLNERHSLELNDSVLNDKKALSEFIGEHTSKKHSVSPEVKDLATELGITDNPKDKVKNQSRNTPSMDELKNRVVRIRENQGVPFVPDNNLTEEENYKNFIDAYAPEKEHKDWQEVGDRASGKEKSRTPTPGRDPVNLNR
ncbi:relaxase/mobilization nuclease domain-containing protein [Marinicella sp. W31]|uniref:relaxase/mobilization nuclease domain-containing protein n=1 Tax=Marinicella sp. W31 TaxID=3023713 RepID=UPI003756348F